MSGVMQAIGAGSTAFSKCTVTGSAKNCTAKEPIVAAANATTFESGEGMGGELVPSGVHFTDITFEGASCGLKGLVVPVDGSATVTDSGATAVFKAGESHLTMGGTLQSSSVRTHGAWKEGIR